MEKIVDLRAHKKVVNSVLFVLIRLYLADFRVTGAPQLGRAKESPEEKET